MNKQKKRTTPKYTMIETMEALQDFCDQNRDVDYLSFDTEFIGEKRYYPKLCLIQAATVHGNYLIDPIKLKDIRLFLELISSPNILKITHSGENDYRILYNQFGVTPKNTFDTQIAAGFAGYSYPVSFQRLINGELKFHVDKGFSVSDWESRPINTRQLQYALNDVIYLKDLYDSLKEKLSGERFEWAGEEMQKREDPTFYFVSPLKEIANNSLIYKLRKTQDKIFLLRILRWRDNQARQKDASKNMILDGKMLNEIAKNMGSGRAALRNHRRIPSHILRKYEDALFEMYEETPTKEELELLKALPKSSKDNPEKDIFLDVLYLYIKYKAVEFDVAPSLLISKRELQPIKTDNSFFPEVLKGGWRKKLLGETCLNWIRDKKPIRASMVNGQLTWVMKA